MAVACLGAFLATGLTPRNSGQPTDLKTEWQTFRKTVQPFFAKHCFDCHTDKKRGDVRLDHFDEKALARRSPTLEKVLDMLGKHAMPPKKRTTSRKTRRASGSTTSRARSPSRQY